MKFNKKPSNPSSKALRERYARLLNMDAENVILEDEESSENEHKAAWYVFLVVILFITLGAWYLFESVLEQSDSVGLNPANRGIQKPFSSTNSTPTLNSLPLTSQATSELADSIAETKTSTDSQSLATEETVSKIVSMITEESKLIEEPKTSDKPNRLPVISSSFLVVLHSTKSKDEAINLAKSHRNKLAYPIEVILSSSGYYGVVIQTQTRQHASDLIKTLKSSGMVKNQPYMMTTERVKEYINPEATP